MLTSLHTDELQEIGFKWYLTMYLSWFWETWGMYSEVDHCVLFWLRSHPPTVHKIWQSQGMANAAWIQACFWIPNLYISCVVLSFTSLNLQLTHLWNKDNEIYLIRFYGKQIPGDIKQHKAQYMKNKSSKLPFFLLHLVHNTRYIP